MANMISYRQGIRSKGFQITVPTTGAVQTLSLSGLAKSFEGILLSGINPANGVGTLPPTVRITLTINNDVAIDDDSVVSYGIASPTFAGGFPFFIPIPRALTGQDTITLRITNGSGASVIINTTVWYRNEL